MTGLSNVSRLSLVLLLAGLVLLAAVAPAWADEGGAEAKPADSTATGKGAMTHEELEGLLKQKPLASFAMLLLKFLPVLVGIGLLIAWYLKQDKIKGGVLPKPAPAEPTLVFSPGSALLLVLLGFAIGPAVFTGLFAFLFAGGIDVESWRRLPRGLAILGMVLPTLAVAVFVLVRRRRIHRAGPEAFRARFERGALPTKPPSFLRGFGLGWWTYCVAGVLVLPASFLWALLLLQMGKAPTVQDTIRVVVQDADQSVALIIFFFGVFIAPFTEEIAFRGLLYPAIKHGLGGGKRGARWGILITSAVFAGIHGDITAVLPLFALALVLNWVFERTNSLAAVIVAHAVHNALSLVPLLMLRYLP